MKWVLDIDGTIDANPSFFSWLTYHLKKPNNNNTVIIVTCRNPKRQSGTIKELQSWNILYDEIYFMPLKHDRKHKSLLEWKLKKVIEINPDIWFDDEIKLYSQLYTINLNEQLPNCNMVQV